MVKPLPIGDSMIAVASTQQCYITSGAPVRPLRLPDALLAVEIAEYATVHQDVPSAATGQLREVT